MGAGRVSLKTGRGYDAVAESLHRIQQKLTGGRRNRDDFLQGRRARLSGRHSALSECKEQWDQSCFDEKEATLYKNCQKAELQEKKRKKKNQQNTEKATKAGDSQYVRDSRFQAGQEAMLSNLKRYQQNV